MVHSSFSASLCARVPLVGKQELLEECAGGIDEEDELEEEQGFQEEERDYIDEIYMIIDAVVPRTDRPKLRALTARVWLLGLIFGTALCIANTLFSFRTNTLVFPAIIPVLLAYPCGKFMEKLPRGVFNPGRFNHKEHALIFVICSTMAQPPYALYNIVAQRYMIMSKDADVMSLSLASAIMFAIVTQCLGYGFAGLTRRYLVRPAVMLWPANLSIIAMLNSIHRREDVSKGQYPMSRFRFFWLTSSAMFFFTFLPQYAAPMLGALSVICWAVSNNPNPETRRIALALGSSSPGGGVGFLSFTLDWSLFSTNFAPITSPLWAIINQFVGTWLFCFIVVPLCWWFSVFGGDQIVGQNTLYGFALNTAFLYNKNGTKLSAARFVGDNLALNTSFYDTNKPIYITTSFAIIYLSSFMVFTSALVHVALWYGKDIWNRFRASMSELDMDDIHAKLMSVYPEVPDWWYFGMVGIMSFAGIMVAEIGGFELPWWSVMVAIVLALVSMVPIGIIQAISGQQIGLNVMSEFVIGLILPGRIVAVMAFKTISYMSMYQGLNFTSDLKLGHYMKIPPRSMFMAQLISTIWAAIVSTTCACALFQLFGRDDQGNWKLANMPDHSEWNLQGYQVFFSAGALWGAIGPARFFGPGSPYSATLYGFLVGAALPIIPWTLHKLQPDSWWHLINVPLMLVIPQNPYSQQSNLITPLIVAVAVNYFVKKYRTIWWKKYAYVMSAGFDCGSSLAVLIVCFFAKFQSNFLRPFPPWFLNPADNERCLPANVLQCLAHKTMGNGFNQTYDALMDPACIEILSRK
ncbi:OPT oligopeptide transporter protein-domain-containing protein [Chytriomyces sp. MP71]|nr:OPT oligopeptide transporter protein-domain-containing protein [Chytriomyces sp. MP71]